MAASASRSLVRLQASKKPVPSKAPAPVETDAEDIGTVGIATAAAGLIFNPLVIWSEYTLKTTGAGLPPGPGGLVGAAEGVGYLVREMLDGKGTLPASSIMERTRRPPVIHAACAAQVVVGIVAWSIYTKATTGKGLPAGPNGLLGAAEGLSFLSFLGGECVGLHPTR